MGFMPSLNHRPMLTTDGNNNGQDGSHVRKNDGEGDESNDSDDGNRLQDPMQTEQDITIWNANGLINNKPEDELYCKTNQADILSIFQTKERQVSRP